MKNLSKCFLLVISLLMVVPVTTISQVAEDSKLTGGIQFSELVPATEFNYDNGLKHSYLVRGLGRYQYSEIVGFEIGLGYGALAGFDFDKTYWQTEIIPVDLRVLLTPFGQEAPYFYAGTGALIYRVKIRPSSVSPKSVSSSALNGVLPVGIGITKKLTETVSIDISGGFSYSFTDNLNYYKLGKPEDAYYQLGIGLIFSGNEDEKDYDQDGLKNGQEKALGTDPKNPDSDGDGLKDGDEVNLYKTLPLKADTDGDGLKDGEEVLRYKTDPLVADTDKDGLKDGEEVMQYNTDPLVADTDKDGLKDGEEVLKYKTDPLNPDTDGDRLKDGEEVNKYKTDPLKADTDGGSVNDGKEIANGTNPLDPADDVPKKEEIKVEVGKSIVLEGIVFKTASAEISPESASMLEKAYNTMAQNPEVEVEIQGHTDNVGKHTYNMKLSQSRADAVKAYLVNKGIAAARITTIGFGPDKPVVPNTTPENKQKNRRIEFFRTK
jgi:outer membrane protein OmpA-like peptidoglycan-associated protein